MAARPVRNKNLKVRRDDEGNVVITIPRRRSWWANFLATILNMPDEKKVALDKIGTAVWDQCNGKRTVQAIVEFFVEKYKLNRREAEVSMFAYLKELTKRGFIGFRVNGRSADGPEAGGEKSRTRRK